MNRRDFLKLGAAGGAGPVVGGLGVSAYYNPTVTRYASLLEVSAFFGPPPIPCNYLKFRFNVGGYVWTQKIKEGESAMLSLWGRVTNDGRYISYKNFWGRHFEFEVERADSKPIDEPVSYPKWRDALIAIYNTSPVSHVLYSTDEYDIGERGIPTAIEFKRGQLCDRKSISAWPGGGGIIFTQEDLDKLDDLL